MLTNDPDTLQAIIDALREWHRGNPVEAPHPGGVAINEDTFEIAYGFGGTQHGRISIQRGQFEVNRVTDDNDWEALGGYNHHGTGKTNQNYVDALKCNNLNDEATYASRLIYMSSECARSDLVTRALKRLFTYPNTSMNDDQWAGFDFALHNYAHTAAFAGYNINAGEEPWEPLTATDYLQYINQDPSFNGSKSDCTSDIHALNSYANG